MTTRSGIGDAPQRRKDVRVVTDRGRSLDDLVFDGLTHAVILASQEQLADVHGFQCVLDKILIIFGKSAVISLLLHDQKKLFCVFTRYI